MTEVRVPRAEDGHRSVVRLTAPTSAARRARWTVRTTCAGSSVPDRLVDDAALAAGEMVTAAVRMRRGEVDLVVVADGGGVLVRVQARGGPAGRAAPRHSASTARCLATLSRSSRSWGLADTASRYELWARLTPR